MGAVVWLAETLEAVDNMCLDEQTRKRVRESEERPGAIWHLFRACDTNKIREFLVKVRHDRYPHMLKAAVNVKRNI